MAARKPNLRSAAADFGFLAVGFIAGVVGAGLPVACLVFLAAVFAWWFTRRAALAQMPLNTRLTQTAISLLMLAVVIGIFYWIGLGLGGHL